MSANPETKFLACQLRQLLQPAIETFADKGVAGLRHLEDDIDIAIGGSSRHNGNAFRYL